MRVSDLSEKMGITALCLAGDTGREIAGGYTGDLMSVAMSGLGEGEAWITVQTNLNVVAVAALCGAACIIIARGGRPEAAVMDKAKEEGISIFSSEKSAFRLSCELCALI